MIAKELTEYRILNEQLMTKAMALLESADNLIIEQEFEKAKYEGTSKRDNDLVDSTLEYSKTKDTDVGMNTFDCIDDIIKSSEELQVNIENIGFDETIKSMEKIKNKFTFPRSYSETDNMFEVENTDETNESLSDMDDNSSDKIRAVTMQNSIDQQKDTDSIVERLLKTKLSIQQNRISGSAPKSVKINTANIEKSITDTASSADKINNNCIKFLKSKIESQQEEINNANEKLKKKTLECEELSKTNQSLQEMKIRLMTQINNLKSQTFKKDSKITALNSKIQTVEGECRTVKNEHDILAKAAKEAAHEISGTEVRLSRALKEISSLKEGLNNAKQREKEMKDLSRKQMEELISGIKAAEKREKTILSAVKKQTLLIDNLKKQIIYLNSKANIDETEKQLDGILKS